MSPARFRNGIPTARSTNLFGVSTILHTVYNSQIMRRQDLGRIRVLLPAQGFENQQALLRP